MAAKVPQELDRFQLQELLREVHYWLDTGQRPDGEIPTDDWIAQSFAQVLHEFDHLQTMVNIVNEINVENEVAIQRLKAIEKAAQKAVKNGQVEHLQVALRRTDRLKRG